MLYILYESGGNFAKVREMKKWGGGRSLPRGSVFTQGKCWLGTTAELKLSAHCFTFPRGRPIEKASYHGLVLAGS